ncbi:MAG: hypothetical protein M3O02_12700 [Acidobacteriota bacterium]|nr:hypothetical protein [Acidobacteriota bacterium]
MNDTLKLRFSRAATALALATLLIAGCKSKQDEAIDLAKKQAATTGQAQQVVTVDKDGNTTTVVVQPPAPGQATQQITTTTTSATKSAVPANAPAVAGGGPVVGPVNGAAPGYANSTGQAGQPAEGYGPASAVAGGGPVIRPVDVHIPAGSTLAIRINQHISVKTTPVGSHFSGEIAEPWSDANGRVILPRGTAVGGVVDASHKRGHFKGASLLELRLTTLSLNGREYPIDTHDVVKTKKGKGKRSAAFIGGGTGLGMLIGGLAGGGIGLAAGGAAGAGAGTAVAGLTGNRDLDIPAESLLRFTLAEDLMLRP